MKTELRTVRKRIPVTRSSMPPLGDYVKAISGLWDSRWLTNAGALHEELTARLKERLDAEEFTLFCNGHMALELGLQALGLTGEVITTPFTFASTTQAVVRCGLTPVFCDIDPVRYTIDPAKIEALITPQTTAILGVHVYGIPCDTAAIAEIAQRHGLKVIYDAAHAFDVRYRGQAIARYGDYSMFSFHATKVFHTIEGGGAAFNGMDLRDRLIQLRDFGLCGGDACRIGTNAKLSEFHAAMGLCNLKLVDGEIQRRKLASDRYDERLAGIEGLQLFPKIDGLKRNYAYYPVVFHDEFGWSREQVAERLKENGIYARKYFYPLTSGFQCFCGRFAANQTPVAENIANRVLCLPLYADLTADEVDCVCDMILQMTVR